MFGNNNNNRTYQDPGVLPGPDNYRNGQGARTPFLNPDVNIPFPAQQMAAALTQYGSAILPYWSSLTFDYTVADTAVQKSVSVDASYYFFIFGASFFMSTGSSDYGTALTSIQINTLTNFVQNPLPVVMFTQYTAAPPPFFLVVPATSELTIEITNGSTATNHVRMTVWGQRVPAKLANKILDMYGMQPLG